MEIASDLDDDVLVYVSDNWVLAISDLPHDPVGREAIADGRHYVRSASGMLNGHSQPFKTVLNFR